MAVCWAVVLVGQGMVLAPAQAAVRAGHQRRWERRAARRLAAGGIHVQPEQLAAAYYESGHCLDLRWWWKPVWGCAICCAGQLGLWGYVALAWGQYDALHHLYFISLTLLLAAGWRAFYAWTTTK